MRTASYLFGTRIRRFGSPRKIQVRRAIPKQRRVLHLIASRELVLIGASGGNSIPHLLFG